MDLVSLGELLLDMFPAETGRSLVEVTAFHPKPGGAPANVAVAAARLGIQSAFIGKVGDEAFGRFLAETLRREGVNCRGMRFDPTARTGLAFIAMPDVNTQEFVFYRNPSADMLLRPDELDRDLLTSAKALHFGSLSLTQEPSRGAAFEAVRLAREAGALISFDVNYRPPLWDSPHAAKDAVLPVIPQVDLLKVNEVELELLSGSSSALEACPKLLELGPSLVVVTLGPEGSFFQTAQGGEAVPAFQVDTVDATGCGDAFIAALLGRLVGDGPWQGQLGLEQLRDHLQYANAAGALTAQKLGVIPALPTAAEVEQFLHQGGTKQSA
jgi:fructokinase